jgi:Abnormal spindle-like microcephaly-assoc'd, ASPM-SPD-2-Hydin
VYWRLLVVESLRRRQNGSSISIVNGEIREKIMRRKSFGNRKSFVLVVAIFGFVLPLLLGSNARAQSQTFPLKFYGIPGFQAGVVSSNISMYPEVFAGSIEIADSALGIPDNIILYRDPAFLKFDAQISTSRGLYEFDLADPNDKFPGDPYTVNHVTKSDLVQGLRLDDNGQPKRFDSPTTSTCCLSEIRKVVTGVTVGPELTLYDGDTFDYVELADGTLLVRKNLAGRTPVATVGGIWSFNPGQGDTHYSGIYFIGTPPIVVPAPAITVTPTTLGFLTVGTETTLSKSLTVKNTANGGILTGNVPTLVAPFSVTAGGGAFSLSAGQAKNVTVQFTPTTPGAVTANLVITSNDPNKPSTTVKVTGTGQTGQLSVLSTVTFFSKPTVPKAGTLTIRNLGLGVLHGNVGTSTGPFVVTVGGGAFTLSHSQTKVVTIQFTPPTKGSFMGALPLQSDDPNHLSLNVNLKGTGQ